MTAKIGKVCYCKPGDVQTDSNNLTLIIRTDRRFATQKPIAHFDRVMQEITTPIARQKYEQTVLGAYQTWGMDILSVWAENLDYQTQYKLADDTPHQTDIHFYNADQIALAALSNADQKIDPRKGPKIYISLDDMIGPSVLSEHDKAAYLGKVRFSRLFSMEGEQLNFVGSPGEQSLPAQIGKVRQQIELATVLSNQRPQIILVEDNVRHAKTLNWIIQKMDDAGCFKRADLAAIATCFCVADDAERAKIKHGNKIIPVGVGADYAHHGAVDVVTPRDHLFDGFVVEVDGGLSRLPAFFLGTDELARNFKVPPENAETFRQQVGKINDRFCAAVEEVSGRPLPVAAFSGGAAIAKKVGVELSTPMRHVLALVSGAVSAANRLKKSMTSQPSACTL